MILNKGEKSVNQIHNTTWRSQSAHNISFAKQWEANMKRITLKEMLFKEYDHQVNRAHSDETEPHPGKCEWSKGRWIKTPQAIEKLDPRLSTTEHCPVKGLGLHGGRRGRQVQGLLVGLVRRVELGQLAHGERTLRRCAELGRVLQAW